MRIFSVSLTAVGKQLPRDWWILSRNTNTRCGRTGVLQFFFFAVATLLNAIIKLDDWASKNSWSECRSIAGGRPVTARSVLLWTIQSGAFQGGSARTQTQEISAIKLPGEVTNLSDREQKAQTHTHAIKHTTLGNIRTGMNEYEDKSVIVR